MGRVHGANDAARRTIYLENQAIPIMEAAAPLLSAMDRGVEVILLVPSTPDWRPVSAHDRDRLCVFCWGRMLETTPEKSRLVVAADGTASTLDEVPAS